MVMPRALGLVMLTAGVAHAGPLASLTNDAVEATLDTDGVVHLGGPTRGEVKLAPRLTRAQLIGARYRGQDYVIAKITAPGAPGRGQTTEAVILRAEAGRWTEVARTPIGGVGLDQDDGVDVDATRDGIFRFQTRGDVRRCDGEPALLFAEKFDGTKFRRASALPSLVPDTATVLTARRDPVVPAPPQIYRARAASHEVGVADAGGLAIPKELDDGRLDSGWREELAGSAGEGQFFTFESRAASARAVQLRIVPGAPTSSQAMHQVNRPRRLAIVAAALPTPGAPAQAWRVELPDAASEPLGAAYTVELPPITGCVTVVLESTYGAPRGTTAIAELEIYADGERQGGGDALLAQVVADGADGAVTAAAALGKRGAAGATAIDAALGKTTDRGARQRLIGALVQIHDPTAAPALVHAATVGWVQGPALHDVIDALGGLGQSAALATLAADKHLALDAREAAVARLPVHGDDAALLIGLAGTGAPELRRAVMTRMIAMPLDELLAAVPRVQAPAAQGDVWHAVARRARSGTIDGEHRGAAVAAMRAALPGAADYERRYRLVDGIAMIGDGAALDALAAWLAALPADGNAAALRQVAAQAVELRSDAVAARFAIGLARDRDPGVRMAALRSLAASDAQGDAAQGDAQAGAALGEALARDTWPEVRRGAAVALGKRCQRPGPAAQALVTAVDRDRDVDVRGDALAALVECHAAGTGALLARVWNDDKAPLVLRSRAVLAAIALGEPAPAAALVERFTHWRGAASDSAEALALVQDAAAAIGQLHPPGAARALTEALDDSAFPEIVQSAALGLGALGPACPADAKAVLARIAQSESSGEAALAAKRAVAQCGR